MAIYRQCKWPLVREIQWSNAGADAKRLPSIHHILQVVTSINVGQPRTDLILVVENVRHRTVIKQAGLQFSVWVWNDLFDCLQIARSRWPNYTEGGHCPPFHQRPVIAAISYGIGFTLGLQIDESYLHKTHRIPTLKMFHPSFNGVQVIQKMLKMCFLFKSTGR